MRWPTIRRLAAVVVIVAGCIPVDDKASDDALDAGRGGATDWTLYDGDTGAAESAVDTGVSDSGGLGLDPACPQPTACISLAEAVDRGFASVTWNGELIVDNFGPYDVCAGRWHTFFSETSQDAIAGHADAEWPAEPEDAWVIESGTAWMHDYARSEGDPAWWCIERTQVTNPGSAYRFTGARAPEPLMAYVMNETDTNDNGVEDHDDYADPTTGAPWTNHNIWDHVAEEPVYVVGRIPNYVELRPGESAPLTIEVVNLGREASTLRVSETLPAGVRGHSFSVTPSSSTTHSDGSTTHEWAFKMSGAEDDADTSAPTTYDIVRIDYQATWERPDCNTREKTWAPEVSWTSESGSFTSTGTELVLVCCDGPSPP